MMFATSARDEDLSLPSQVPSRNKRSLGDGRNGNPVTLVGKLSRIENKEVKLGILLEEHSQSEIDA